MRNWILILSAASLVSFLGCTKKEKVVIRLDNINITEDEVLAAYRASPHFVQGEGTLKAFLDEYISKKTILLEAERRGLDKDPEFLSEIQQYWEQELLKLTLAKVNGRLSLPAVTQADIEDFFNRQPGLFNGKSLDEVRDQIADYLAKARRQEGLKQWLEDIKGHTHVEVDYAALGVQ